MKRIGALSLVCLTAVWAQEGRVAGPISGLVYDESAKAIRPMLGIPGASYLGSPVAEGLDAAAIAPNGKLAIASIEGSLHLLRLDGMEPARKLLRENAAAPQRMVWNNASNAVAVLSEGKLELWTNLDAEAQAGDMGALPESAISALVVDRAARSVVVATSDGVYVLGTETPRLAARAGRVAGLALSNGDNDLFFADADSREILVIRDFRNSSGATVFANAEAGVEDPVALALSSDDKTLFVAGRKSLLAFERVSGALAARFDLSFEPSRLEAFGDGGLFRLNSRDGNNTLQVLAGGATPGVFFVPSGE